MHEQSGGYRDETEAVDLGNPVSVSCDATKFDSSSKVSGGADSIGGRKSSVEQSTALFLELSEDIKS